MTLLPPEQPKTAAIDAKKTKMVKQLKHSSPMLCCRYDPTGRFLFGAGQDFKIQRWELSSGKGVMLEGHQSWIRGLALDARRKKLFSGDFHGKLLVWPYEADAPKPERTIQAHDGWIRMVALSPDGNLLATAGNDHLVKLWNTEDMSLVRELRGHESHVYNVAFHPRGQFVVSADHKCDVKQWEISTGKEVRSFDAGMLAKFDKTFVATIGGVRGMAFNQDGSRLACSGITDVTNAFAGVGKPAILLFDWENGKRLKVLRPQKNFQGTAWGVVFHPSGLIIGSGGGRGGAIWFWKPDNDKSIHTVSEKQTARDLALHPNGKQVAVPYYERIVKLYDLGSD